MALEVTSEMELESSLHLYHRPRYRAADGTWHDRFEDAVRQSAPNLSWDPAALLSMVSFGFTCGEQTLFREIRRLPWLSRVEPDGRVHVEPIPAHDTLWLSYAEIAEELMRRLCEEVRTVCRDRKEIWVLLSGGLDSRIAAATLSKLRHDGDIAGRIIAITWGLADSRDVVYGQMTAEALDLEWRHLDVGPQHLIENLGEVGDTLGCLVPPSHLHRMPWFKGASEEVLVLAASYGDSVGRAEFSGRRLVDLRYLRPLDRFNLLAPDIRGEAQSKLHAVLKALHDRAPGQPDYVHCEHEQQAQYMRGLIGHAMSVINSHTCRVYQLLTAPLVYSFMWSVHPALRFDEVYAILMERLSPPLARLPWARTNRALRGRTRGARRDLRSGFHEYRAWIRGPLYDHVREVVEPDWFAETGVFNAPAVRNLGDALRGDSRVREMFPYEMWLWLAALRHFAGRVEEWGGRLEKTPSCAASNGQTCFPASDSLGRRLRNSPRLVRCVRRTRVFVRRWQARVKYPPRRPKS